MAMNVKIDFDDVYEVEGGVDLSTNSFHTQLEDGSLIKLKIKIDPNPHPLFDNVYNLAFGPENWDGGVDDRIQLKHSDYQKVFSTILWNAYLYLKSNPTHSIGINGSDFRRACLYYRLIRSNYDYLNEFFEVKGLKYYVRISRLGKVDYEDPFDFDDIVAYPQKITRDEHIDLDKLYNYFIFKKKK